MEDLRAHEHRNKKEQIKICNTLEYILHEALKTKITFQIKKILERMMKRVIVDKLSEQPTKKKSVIISNIIVITAEMEKILRGKIESEIGRIIIEKGITV